jgi:parallel beta-helix repeat protein
MATTVAVSNFRMDTASGVTMTNNNVHDNGDNGIGIVGLQGPGENVVSNNTVLNNGRFGIEVKNPNGSRSSYRRRPRSDREQYM